MSARARMVVVVLALLVLIAIIIFWEGHLKPGAVPERIQALAVDRTIVPKEGTPIMVLRVVDGDTIELANGDHLRYIGIDTPEEVDARKPVQCFAREAALENKMLVEGKMITFYKDVNARDTYGRLLGFVYLPDGTFVNQKLVEEGYAFAYPFPPDISKADVFSAGERDARTAHSGLWTDCTIHTTSYGKEQTNAL